MRSEWVVICGDRCVSVMPPAGRCLPVTAFLKEFQAVGRSAAT